MNTRQRIFLRVLRFVSYSWWLPFFVGSVFSFFVVGLTQIETLKLMETAFETSITKVVAQCVQ